jgi:hypothetical protein
MQIGPEKLLSEVIAGLRGLGYYDPLLQEDYKFADWFSPTAEERQVAAAAFGQTPVSYDSACIGVACANGVCGQALVNQYRALGAPVFLELTASGIQEWAVSRKENGHGLVERYSSDRIGEMFVTRAADWRPESLLRAKNIGSFSWSEQLGLFAGLLPELEEHIQEKLDPLLRETLSATKAVYRDTTGRQPDAAQLFKLVFWILTAKVFYDRRVNGFINLSSDADQLLDAVAKQYKTDAPKLLNRRARQEAAARIWRELDFRNLSVEVLSQIWSTTLVDDDTKLRLGIHRTSRTIVRYIVERIPFEQFGDDRRIILEPCAGSAVFLIGVMNELRHKLFGTTPAERHRYFVQHLAGVEKDPFAVEISRLALTLADFPNSDSWNVVQQDVFLPNAMTGYLQRAGVVLCNPPFGDFDENERRLYQPSSTHRPAELLQRVLFDLHPRGVIGFVLPRNIVDGRGYAGIRKQLAQRFATIELTLLPDRAFEADSEVGLVIATDPIPHKFCRVINRKVNDNAEAWAQFEHSHAVSTDYPAEIGIEEAVEGFAVPELPELWAFLVDFPTLEEFAEIHRGIQWNQPLTKDGIETGHRSSLVRNEPDQGYMRGVAPRTTFNVFEQPEMFYLSMRANDQLGNAWQFEWDKPKAILNKSARSRGAWRIAAFPDSEGVTCYQTFIGVWPKSDRFDEWLLSAILNSPVANAFVATREGKTDITMEILRLIPVPHFTESQREKLRSLIKRYQGMTNSLQTLNLVNDPDRVLKQIDATVLDGYRIPPRLERRLLDFFRGHTRPTSHDFSEYIPQDCGVYFSLSEYLSPDFAAATSGELLKRLADG